MLYLVENTSNAFYVLDMDDLIIETVNIQAVHDIMQSGIVIRNLRSIENLDMLLNHPIVRLSVAVTKVR